MRGKLYILFFVSSFFSAMVFGQSKKEKNDSTTSARQIISKDQGEKDLPNQLKKNQLQKDPQALKTPIDTTATKNKHTKTKRHKHNGQNKKPFV